jgi:hypothetical protein
MTQRQCICSHKQFTTFRMYKIHHYQSCMHKPMSQQQCICSHKQFTTPISYMNSLTYIHSQTTYMYSSIISQSINIYVLANNITINQHVCNHQHRLYHIVQQLHTISHNSSKGENTIHYDRHHIQHLESIHISSYNHNKPSTKDLPSIWS